MTRKILFVDDEPRVLQGLKRMLRSMRNEWDMHFAEGGHAALSVLENDNYDVIVTDMRMPGMDGSQLLEKVMAKYPNIVRIVLSGHSDQEVILKTVKPAHQFLSKPCDATTVKTTIAQACKLQDLLNNEDIKNIVSQIDTLPSIPSIYTEIVDEMESLDPSIKNVGEIIEKDIGMSAKVLQLVNSAFFGLPRHVSSPSHAVSLLGMEIVKSLVLSIHIFSEFDQGKVRHFSLNQLWEHSILVSRFSKRILELEKQDETTIDYGFLSGMLHDIGKLILAANMPDKYDIVLRLSKEGALQIHEAEEQVFSTNHSDVGAYLLGLWGLPHPIVEAVAFHHSIDTCRLDKISPAIAVHYSNYLEHQINPKCKIDGQVVLNSKVIEVCETKNPRNVWDEQCELLLKEN